MTDCSGRGCIQRLFFASMLISFATVFDGTPATAADEPDIVQRDSPAAARREAELIGNARQLTFEGRRAGEGYFSRDGSRMVFQSERESGNPFFQIYLLDMETGDVERVSPGHGKTTCAWIHPDGRRVLFASTHDDPDARKKQADEIKLRESGRERRYSWDYDEHYDVYVRNVSGEYENLTRTRGYDAEGSFSPDGRLIGFASNRRAYTAEMTEQERQRFEHDPATMIDIYLMNADGSSLRQLTDEPGYDGGPFFSPDGRRICWRHFATDGATAEIMTMRLDGSDKRKLTRLSALSWAPFYHPSGEYLIFATNVHGFANFELYLVDAQGKSQPIRTTYTAGFDGLPVFSPDGKKLAWTSNRTPQKKSQIFLADWNHERARQLLGLDRTVTDSPAAGAAQVAAGRAGADAAADTSPAFSPDDVRRHVEYLCRPELDGRLTGTPGERMATAYAAAYFESLGLLPAGDDATWFQHFEFTSGAALGPTNELTRGETSYAVDKDWRPVSFSKTGPVAASPVTFVGYGISATEVGDRAAYDSYVHTDVKDKWVLAFRYLPEDVPAEQRQHLAHYAGLRYKAMVARDHGACGLIVVSGPNSNVKRQLVPLRLDGSLSGSSLPVISVTDDVAASWLKAAGKDLKALQDEFDTGELKLGFDLPDVSLAASIDVSYVTGQGRNVLARLAAGAKPTEQVVVIGAHIDHLGRGRGTNSLARDQEQGEIHFGADDNASGVAALLEVAEYLADLQQRDKLRLTRDIVFAAWSGEELGTIGSSHYVNAAAAASDSHGDTGPNQQTSIYPAVAACLNMDMVGRLDKRLILQGIGSSSIWRGEIERRNAPVGLPITLQEDCYLPTDAGVFFTYGVPILSAFTGPHSDYHTPRDTPDKLNYDGAAQVARLMALITRSVAMREAAPDYVAQQAPDKDARRAHLRAYLGTIPDYAAAGVGGVKLSGVANGGPAAKAGVKAGDVIVELAGKKIDSIYDYTYAIEALKIGQPAKIAVRRGGKRLDLTITPGSRE